MSHFHTPADDMKPMDETSKSEKAQAEVSAVQAVPPQYEGALSELTGAYSRLNMSSVGSSGRTATPSLAEYLHWAEQRRAVEDADHT